MSPQRLSDENQQIVRQRAKYLCEYCHSSEKWQYVAFTIDHIKPVSHGGSENIDNLALACFHCNRQKSNQVEADDPTTGITVPLFNPRLEDWSTHFRWSLDSLYIQGITAIGRATISALKLNRERIIIIRSADLIVNRHPPAGDPVEFPK